MPLPVNPPPGPVSLSANARTVLEKRYLVKNEKGKPVESPKIFSGAWRQLSPRRIGDMGRPRAR